MNLSRRMQLTLLAIISLLVVVDVAGLLMLARMRDRIAELRPIIATELERESPTGGRVGTELQTLSVDTARGARLILGANLAAATLGIVVTLLVWRSMSRRIGALRRAALDIGAGHLDTRFAVCSVDELGLLGSSLNTMAERLETSTQRIATLRAAQRGLRRSLDEKDLLLREAHHRIKNNLQVVSSLLDLQSRSIGDRQVREKFELSQNRIRSMALVHEQLYGAGRFDRVDARGYLNRLATHLVDCFGRPCSIRMYVELEDLQLDVDRAMTLGLLTNELLCNALKHAFPAERSGEVRLTLASQRDDCVLTVADDGVGMPQGSQPEGSRSLGMSLVATLARQLHGSVAIDGTPGTCVRITFPMAGPVQEAAAS